MANSAVPAPDFPVSAVVLAGGHSRRLGTDKAFLKLAGRPLVERVVRRLVELSDDLIVVADVADRYQALELPVRLVSDRVRGMGSLMGVYSGLGAARYRYALVVACDMPFLNAALLQYMIPLAAGYDVVIPRLNGMLEPLHAIYGQTCLPHMARLLEEHSRKITAFLDSVKVRFVEEDEIDEFDPRHLSFLNVNTLEDWQRVQSLNEWCGIA